MNDTRITRITRQANGRQRPQFAAHRENLGALRSQSPTKARENQINIRRDERLSAQWLPTAQWRIFNLLTCTSCIASGHLRKR
jgi:hypothetical protein